MSDNGLTECVLYDSRTCRAPSKRGGAYCEENCTCCRLEAAEQQLATAQAALEAEKQRHAITISRGNDLYNRLEAELSDRTAIDFTLFGAFEARFKALYEHARSAVFLIEEPVDRQGSMWMMAMQEAIDGLADAVVVLKS